MKIRRACIAIGLSIFLSSPFLTTKNIAEGRTGFADQQIQHPRIFFYTQDIPNLRIQAQTTHVDIWEPILEFANSKLDTSPPPSSTCPDLEEFRNAGNQMIAFAFAYVISDNETYLDLTRRYLLGYAQWEYWGDEGGCGGRDLSFHHMLLGNAIAYDWIYNELSVEERTIIGGNLAQRAQESFEASTTPQNNNELRNWWRASYIQNHHWINHSALGIAALILEGEDPRAQTWLDDAVKHMTRDQYLADGIADGSWHEGIPYQSYGLTMSLPFFYNLRRLKGLEILPHTYLRNYAYWRIYNSLPSSTRFALSYGDFEWGWNDPQNVLRFIAREYRDGHAEWMAQQLTDNDGWHSSVWYAPWYVFEFLYYDPSVDAQTPDDLSLNRTFPDLEGVIWRTGWSEDDLIFGLKTGAYGGRFAYEEFINGGYPFFDLGGNVDFNIGHDHRDANSFYLYRGNIDLSSENVGYGMVDTRYHNTLLIDNEGQYWRHYAEKPDDIQGTDGTLEIVYQTTSFNYLVADATDRYRLTDPETGNPTAHMVDEFKRHVLFVRPGYFVMVDQLRAGSPQRYEWVSHFGSSVSIEGDWIRGTSEEDQILGVKVLSPDSFAISTGDDGKPYVRIRPSSDVADARFVIILYPMESGDWEAKPSISSLGNNDQASAVRVILDGIQDHLIRIGNQGMVSIGDYAFDGDVASIIKDTEDRLKRIFLARGSQLSDMQGSRILVQSQSESVVIEIEYDGSALAIVGENIEGLWIYAPDIDTDQVTLNGQQVPASRSGDYILIEYTLAYQLFLPLILR